MRIVHLVHQYPPEFRGGTEACVEGLAAAQTARGDEVLVVAGSDRRDDEGRIARETVGGTAVARVHRRPGENYSMDDRLPRVAGQVVELARAFAPHVVHLHHRLNLSGDLGARLAAAGLPVVATLHDYTLVCARFFLSRPDGESCAQAFPLPSGRCVECVLPDFPAGRAVLEREVLVRAATARAEAAAARVAIAPSESVAGAWRRSGLFDPARLVVLPHPVAPSPAPPAPPRDRSDGRLVLATWGHLAPAKGVLDLLAALRLAADPRLALLVLGDPVDAHHAEALLDAAEGLDVSFLGRYGADDLPRLRAQADLAVFASRAEETFGLSAAEARASGFPVIVSARGALPERVGAAGTTFPAGDPQALAGLLRRLLREPGTLALWAAAPSDDLLAASTHAEHIAALYARALSEVPSR